MCGISGIIRYGEGEIKSEMLDQLYLALEHRGTSATGLALVNDGKIHVHKQDEAAWRFVTSRQYKEFIAETLKPETQAALLHTRAWTKGTPRNMENNHPVYAGKCAIIHNGVIRNDDHIFKNEGLERKAEVDSDVIRAIVDRYGLTHKAVREMSKLNGSVASVCVSNEDPGRFLMLRSGNPLIVAFDKNFMFFASEKHAIHVAARPWKRRLGVWVKPVRASLDWGTFPDQSAWLMGPKGLEWHQEFKTDGKSSWTEPLKKGDPPEAKPAIENKVVSIDKATIIKCYSGREYKTAIICMHCGVWTKSVRELKDIDLEVFRCGKCVKIAQRKEDDSEPSFVG